MPKDFLPETDAGLLAWSENFDAMITASPTTYGLVAADATAYNAKHVAYEAALSIASAPTTRTKPAVLDKNDKRQELRDLARSYSKRIQGHPGLTDAQRAELGLDVPSPRTPVQAPADAPVVELVSMNGWLAKFRMEAAGSESRKAPGALGANIFTYVGPTPPSSIREWVWEGDTTRTTFEVSFPADLAAGTKVWVACNWKTSRFLTSPACQPIGLLVGGGVTTLAA